jgi:hypothetical protein
MCQCVLCVLSPATTQFQFLFQADHYKQNKQKQNKQKQKNYCTQKLPAEYLHRNHITVLLFHENCALLG